MNLGLSNNKKVHKVKARNHITFMVIPDPTKSAKVIKIPKWVRFPIFILIILATFGGFKTLQYVAELKLEVELQNLGGIEYASTLQLKDDLISELQTTNEAHYDRLQTMQLQVFELDEKVQNLDSYKQALDSKLNGAEQTTDAQPAESIEVQAAIQVSSLLPTNLVGIEVLSETVEVDSFDAQADALDQMLQSSLSDINENESSYDALDDELDELIPFWEAYPSGSPLSYLSVTSSYGYRRDPITRRTAWHSGVDFACSYIPVYSAGKGVVVSTGYEGSKGYTVVVSHGYGYKTVYAHLSKILVDVGDQVVRGDQIAKSGNSGRSTGPHLHYEVILNGNTQDPIDYIY